ncbi:uncharacterized protein CCOS01_16138 [Colletotrichum costaricense]|uniref:Insecticidal crystal toxin domain-containing protein n=1 Tax=Colletotrichum costaricense TaxID=1209916 RepID=A0AAI9YG18_9PEZI|nr:uncharacterized protein CCOS01_16138 [Colletotrichum costaricense]KAK1507832.1 hypothetical protein CCOS01_16138 [Colletotrichum costaricense]
MANKTFDYGDLRITMTSSYSWVYHDSGSGATRDVSIWTPNPQGELFPLGDYAEGRAHYNPLSGKRATLLVGQNPNTSPSKSAVARPIDYTRIWSDTGSGATNNGAVWRPVAPAGYVALGDVGNTNYGKPSLDKMWCVREDLVGYGKFLATSAWDDSASGADADVSLWAVQTDTIGVDGAANIPVMADTFRAQSNYNRPGGEAARVLLLPIGKQFEKFDNPMPTITANNLPHQKQPYGDQQLQCQVTLPFHFYFSPEDQTSLDNIRNPFLTVSRSISWYTERVWSNDTPTPLKENVKVVYGVSSERTQEMSHSVGVDVSASYGVGLASGSVSLNYQFTYNTSTSFTEYSEKTITKDITIKEYTATVLFSRHVWIKCTRLDSPIVLHQMEVIANDGEYYTSCPTANKP